MKTNSITQAQLRRMSNPPKPTKILDGELLPLFSETKYAIGDLFRCKIQEKDCPADLRMREERILQIVGSPEIYREKYHEGDVRLFAHAVALQDGERELFSSAYKWEIVSAEPIR